MIHVPVLTLRVVHFFTTRCFEFVSVDVIDAPELTCTRTAA